MALRRRPYTPPVAGTALPLPGTAAPAAAAGPAGDQVLRGILYVVLATLLFGVMDASIKWLGATYPVPQVGFFRSLFGLLPLLPMAASGPGGLRGALRMQQPAGVLGRSLLAPAAMLCIFASFVLLPLAEAITIGFAAPIVMAVLGVFLLGERVGWRRWAAILAGFGGVLIVVRPDGLSLSIGAGLALAGTLIYSLSMVWGRRLMRRDGAMTLALYTHLVAIVVLAAVLPWNWVTPTLPDLALMAVMGIAGGFAALFLTRGYQLGPVAVLGPFDYLNLPVAAFSGWLIWQEIPGTHVWWGAAVIVGSGLYIVHRERQAKAGGGAG